MLSRRVARLVEGVDWLDRLLLSVAKLGLGLDALSMVLRSQTGEGRIVKKSRL